jgi:glycosyltransferase involved in cell wall biosynthesis
LDKKLNFLHLTTFYPPYSFGGDAMYIYRLAHTLADDGHIVDVIHNVDAYHLQHPGPPEIEFDEHPGVTRHELRSKSALLRLLGVHQTGSPLFYQREIDRILTSKRYDVIQFHNISLLGPGVMSIESSNSRCAKLYMTHEHWLVCPMHVLWKFEQRACEKPECLKCVLKGKRPPQLWRYTGMLERHSRNVDRFLSPSRFTAGMHKERGFSQPVQHLPYFIHGADQDWKNPGTRLQERPYFLFVGRLEIIKGLQTLIKTWKRVEDFDLLVVGTGTMESELKSLAVDNPAIKFLGTKTQKQLGSLYYHAVATVVPSITYETFGIIVVESFARKTPVIVRDLGALPEIVRDSDGGFIYRSDEELIEFIHTLGNNQQFRSEKGDNGYNSFERAWSPEAHKKMYYGLLDEIFAEKHDSR